MTDSSRAAVAVIKACLGIAGLWLLVRTEPSAPNAALHEGQVLFKVSGGLVLLLAAIPWRGPRGKAPDASDEL